MLLMRVPWAWLACVRRGQPLLEGRNGLMMLLMRLPLAYLALVEGKRGSTTLLMPSPYAWLAFV